MKEIQFFVDYSNNNYIGLLKPGLNWSKNNTNGKQEDRIENRMSSIIVLVSYSEPNNCYSSAWDISLMSLRSILYILTIVKI